MIKQQLYIDYIINNNNNNNKNAFIKRITKQILNALYNIKTKDKKAQHIYKSLLT